MSFLSRVTDPEGKSLEYRYDSRGRLIKAIDGNGNGVAVEYEKGGDGCSSCSAPSDKPSRIVFPTFSRELKYNSRGTLTEERDVLSKTESHVTRYGYDSAGNPVSVTDREDKTIGYTYDGLNRLERTIDPLSQETLYTHDNRDNLIALTDANGNATRFELDRNIRKVKETRPLGATTSFEYDAVGALISITDPKSQLARYGYDDGRRLTEISTYSSLNHVTPVKTVTFSQDKVGHPTGYDDGETSPSYEYDDSYRRISETVNHSGNSSPVVSQTYVIEDTTQYLISGAGQNLPENETDRAHFAFLFKCPLDPKGTQEYHYLQKGKKKPLLVQYICTRA